MAKRRFVRTHAEGGLTATEIWVDTETGVNHLFHHTGHAAGLTPLLSRDGAPIVSPLPVQEEA